MFKNYFKTAFRHVWKNKAFSALNIFGLAVGIACAGLIFLWVENEKTFDDANVKKDNLYALVANQNYGGDIFTNWSSLRPMGRAMQREIPGVINTCRFSDEGQKVLFNAGNNKVYATGKFADASLFKMFTIKFTEGNANTAFKQLYSLVITQKTAKKFFGNDDNVVGKTVRMDNRHDFVVTGVISDFPENSSLQAEWLAPFAVSVAQLKEEYGVDEDTTVWEGYGPFTYVELSPTANVEAINKKLYNFIGSKNPKQQVHALLFPMSQWHLHGDFANGKPTGGGKIQQVHMLSAIAWVILLIACINFMNLSTARSTKYARETGIRKVLGSSRPRLVWRFIAEALAVSAMAGVLAIIIMLLALPAFNQLMQAQLVLQLAKPVHIAAFIVIITVCGLVAGSYPALYLSSFNPIAVLKGLNIKTGGAAFVRKGLIVLQFTVSVIFIIATMVIYLQVQHIKNRELGFNKDMLVEIDMQHDVTAAFTTIKEHLLATGTIQNAAMSTHVMIGGGDTDDRFSWQGKAKGTQTGISFRSVTPEFVSTYGMHIIQGRDFTSADMPGTSNILINKSMANLLGKGSAVGKIIQSPRGIDEGKFENTTVVGVIDDYVYGGVFDAAPMPQILYYKPITYGNLLYAKIKPTGNLSEVLDKIETVMKKDNPAYPLQYRFVDDEFNQMFESEAQMGKVASVFALLAITISCLGLFGLAAYTAERRFKEIGIRKVLGASVTGLSVLLSKDFLQLVGVSCLLSFPIAGWLMYEWLQGYEYRISMHWWMFAAAGITAALIAVVTISFQTVRAALTNPVKSLRAE